MIVWCLPGGGNTEKSEISLHQEVAGVIQYVTFLFHLSQGSTGQGPWEGYSGRWLKLDLLKVTAFFFLHNKS